MINSISERQSCKNCTFSPFCIIEDKTLQQTNQVNRDLSAGLCDSVHLIL